MDPELQKQINEKLAELGSITKELDALKQKALSAEYKQKAISPELWPYRTPGEVTDPDPPRKGVPKRQKREKPWETKELLNNRTSMFRDQDYLFDSEGMKKCQDRYRRATMEVDAVEVLKIYEWLMQHFEAYPPCTLNAKDYLECATFKRGIRDDQKDNQENKS